MTTTTTLFMAALMNEVDRIRGEFKNRDYHQMEFEISVRGPVHGELLLEFKVDSNYETNSVHGNSIETTLEEFFRRHAWQRRHNALALPYTTQSAFANLKQDDYEEEVK